MEGQLVQKTFTLDNIDLDCWVIKIGHKFWLKAHDIAIFFDYKDPNQAVRENVPADERKQWDELEPRLADAVPIPPNWKPHTVLISEGGLYRLLCRSTKPEAIRFEKWVFDDVLPTLNETVQYQLEKSFHELQNKVLELRDKAAVITNSDETKYAFQLYTNLENPNMYLFIRPQTRYLSKAIKKVNSDEYSLLISEVNLPNSMSVLNRLKEKLWEEHVSFKAWSNKLTVDVDVLRIVQELLIESRT